MCAFSRTYDSADYDDDDAVDDFDDMANLVCLARQVSSSVKGGKNRIRMYHFVA